MNIEFPEIHHCKSKDEIIKQIQIAHEAIEQFYRNLPDDAFLANAIPDGWSVKKNMKHVSSTNNFFSLYISLPKFLLRLFGKPKTPQVPIEKLNPTNRPIVKDYGKYTKKDPFVSGEKEKYLKAIIDSSEKLKRAVLKRTEEELDSLPGMFWGMSLRTLAMFVSKHNLHHTNVVKIRISNH